MAATNSRTCFSMVLVAARSVSGVKNVVRSTSQMVMPSMPVLKWTPSDGIQLASVTIW
jgi:hypothetical protein